jgi:hypothetical protein
MCNNALYQLSEEHDRKLVLGVKKVVHESKLYEHCGFVDSTIEFPDIWQDYGLIDGASWNDVLRKNIEYGIAYAKSISDIEFAVHVPLMSCIPPNKMPRYVAACLDMRLEPEALVCDKVYLADDPWDIGSEFDKDYIFIADDKEGWTDKDRQSIEDFAKYEFGDIDIVRSSHHKHLGINAVFDIMSMATNSIVAESCWYHAANAMKVNVDYVVLNQEPDEWLSVILKKPHINFELITLNEIKERNEDVS